MVKELLEEFFEENYSQFKYYLKSRFNELNDYDAEDIIQQTIIKLLYKGDDVLSITNLSAYFYTSLQNGAKDHFKKTNRLVLQDEDIDGPTPTVEETILVNELKQVIWQAINDLDPKSRFIFVETEIKGRSYQSIIEQTGEKLGTLLSRKKRARMKLQKALEHYIRY